MSYLNTPLKDILEEQRVSLNYQDYPQPKIDNILLWTALANSLQEIRDNQEAIMQHLGVPKPQ
jgi:hypothetical protein